MAVQKNFLQPIVLQSTKAEGLVAGATDFFLGEYVHTVSLLVSVPFSRVLIMLAVALGGTAAVTWRPN